MKPILSRLHLEEFEKSGIPQDVAEHCFISLIDSKEIAQKLRWEGYSHTPGWWCEGVCPDNTGNKSGIGQFKPNRTFRFPNGKEVKYLSQKSSVDSQKSSYDAILIDVPNIDWTSTIEDISAGIRITEGAKKAVSSMCNTNVPTIALLGVDMGLQKRTKLLPSLEKFAAKGRPVEICFDSDVSEKEAVKDALIWLATTLKRRGCVVTVRSWPSELGKGFDDIIVAVGSDNLDDFSTVSTYKNWLCSLSSVKENRNLDDRDKKAPQQSKVCIELTKLFKDIITFDVNTKKWYQCCEDTKIWNKIPDELVKKRVKEWLDLTGFGYSDGYLSGLYNLLKTELITDFWNCNPKLLPFFNGILNLDTMILSENKVSNKFNWALPYHYNSQASCEPIIAWLKESVQNDSQVSVLRAYLAAILRGRVDLQKYLELVGPGGTGKGTFIRLAQAIVGGKNCYSTNLHRLETNRFELAAIDGKRLVSVADADQFMGSSKILMSLTGQDGIPFEMKGIQQDDDFYSSAMFIVAGNEPIQGDLTSGLFRRRIVINFENQVIERKKRNLLSINKNGITGDFAPFLPGLIKWCLEMPQDEMSDLIGNTSEFAPSLNNQKLNLLITTNPIADWADTYLIYKPGALSQVGLAKKQNIAINENQFLNCDKWLYANYSEYCLATGNNRLSVRRFTSLLKDLFNNQLKLKIEHLRNKFSYFQNILIRQECDDAPLLISGCLHQENPIMEIADTNTQTLSPTQIAVDNADTFGVHADSDCTQTELISFIKKAIETQDEQLAIEVKNILTEVCNKKDDLRVRVWSSLTETEKIEFKKMIVRHPKLFLETLGELETESFVKQNCDFSQFPSHSLASDETKKNQACQLKNQLLRANSEEELKEVIGIKGRWVSEQLHWVFWKVLTSSQRNKVRSLVFNYHQPDIW
jgi:putative DNA primase/helicase